MRAQLSLLIGSLTLIGVGIERTQSSPLIEKDVITLIDRYDRAWMANDTVTINQILGDRYRYFSSAGKTLDKRHILSWFAPAHRYVTDSTSRRSELEVEVTGDVAVVGSRWQGTGTFDATKFSDDQRCSIVVAGHGSALRILAEHCTQIVKTGNT